MKKTIVKILLFLSLILSFSSLFAVNFNEASEATSKISEVSIAKKTWSMETQIWTITSNVFKTLKIAIGWLLVIYIVYAWVMMIISMWDDEKQLSSAKRSIWYAIVWLLFINIPWTLYRSFSDKRTTDDITWSYWDVVTIYNRNIFMNSDYFWTTLGSIITFLEITVVALAIFVFIYNWIKIMVSWWEDKNMSEAKSKILWSLAWLIFIWIMEVWRNMVFIWDFKWAWQDMFSRLANLALFFAWPVAIFFISLAWYYYITAWWEEEKVKKAKNIIINTALATLILLWMYTFLLDLWTLSF